MDRIQRLKSTPVYFYVQRNSSFFACGIIPFNSTVVNEGNAMDFTSGIFTAPQPGIYFFSFSGHAKFESQSSGNWAAVFLILNGNQSIGMSWIRDFESPNVNIYKNDIKVRIQSAMNLKKGDRRFHLKDRCES
jgi:hypothetical protein